SGGGTQPASPKYHPLMDTSLSLSLPLRPLFPSLSLSLSLPPLFSSFPLSLASSRLCVCLCPPRSPFHFVSGRHSSPTPFSLSLSLPPSLSSSLFRLYLNTRCAPSYVHSHSHSHTHTHTH